MSLTLCNLQNHKKRDNRKKCSQETIQPQQIKFLLNSGSMARKNNGILSDNSRKKMNINKKKKKEVQSIYLQPQTIKDS